ncbi:unnamed protein product [Protopolystoma xenopodis]|uniref:Uncharacterized protein n=1 Tax=Protopolystoma xenopodis TaxID=117903 RepID=A0A3S5AIL1_9PLAT|nr:unnamed protein product [Protopolystoma xenopodis]
MDEWDWGGGNDKMMMQARPVGVLLHLPSRWTRLVNSSPTSGRLNSGPGSADVIHFQSFSPTPSRTQD